MAEPIFSAFVTNLGRYNEGYLIGEFLNFPCTTQDVQGLLNRIGIDGVRYEEIFISDYDSNVFDLCSTLGEYENINELNYLAHLIEELSPGDLDTFKAVLEWGDHSGSAHDLINLVQNLDCYSYYPGISDAEDLGRYYVDELGTLEVPEHLQNYIDYESYGRDISLETDGEFISEGYIRNDGGYRELYSDHEDIPDECRVFEIPKATIRKKLEVYQEIVEQAAKIGAPAPALEFDAR